MSQKGQSRTYLWSAPKWVHSTRPSPSILLRQQLLNLSNLAPPAVGHRAVALYIADNVSPVVPDLKTPAVAGIVDIADHLPPVIRYLVALTSHGI